MMLWVWNNLEMESYWTPVVGRDPSTNYCNYFFFGVQCWLTLVTVSTKILSSTTVFNIDDNQKCFLSRFLTDHVTLKNRAMMLKGINYIFTIDSQKGILCLIRVEIIRIMMLMLLGDELLPNMKRDAVNESASMRKNKTKQNNRLDVKNI